RTPGDVVPSKEKPPQSGGFSWDEAEREGFEPSTDGTARNGFRDNHDSAQPPGLSLTRDSACDSHVQGRHTTTLDGRPLLPWPGSEFAVRSARRSRTVNTGPDSGGTISRRTRRIPLRSAVTFSFCLER